LCICTKFKIELSLKKNQHNYICKYIFVCVLICFFKLNEIIKKLKKKYRKENIKWELEKKEEKLKEIRDQNLKIIF